MATYQALQFTGDSAKPLIWVNKALPAARTLPPDQVLVAVQYSRINHKDRLALNPKNRIIAGNDYPLVGGIDLAGVITASNQPVWPVGTAVIATGFDLGTARDGGFAEFAQVPIQYLTQLPTGLSAQEAMALGTAGLTAAAALTELFRVTALTDKAAPILITGGHSAVGQIAAGILQRRRYTNVTISSAHDWPAPAQALAHAKYAAALDTVGGDALSVILPQIAPGGTVVAVGNLGQAQLTTSIYPFILRGIRLQGIDSVHLLPADRAELWQLLATNLRPTPFPDFPTISFDQLPAALLAANQPSPVIAVA